MDNGYNTRQTLIMKIRDQHDENSWEDFVYYYRNYIYVVIANMNVSHHDAEDLVQRVLLKVWEALPQFKFDPQKGKFRSWLCTIIRNTVITFIRKKSRNSAKIEKMKESGGDTKDAFMSAPEIDAIAENEWKIHISNLAWENIKDDFSEKTLQCFIQSTDGKKTALIAQELGIEENSVYVYKKRVQDKLIREIKRLDDELT